MSKELLQQIAFFIPQTQSWMYYMGHGTWSSEQSKGIEYSLDIIGEVFAKAKLTAPNSNLVVKICAPSCHYMLKPFAKG